jgi:hypothetical protein
MKHQTTRLRALNVLAGAAFALCIFASQPVLADEDKDFAQFSRSSLQGTYAYVNNTGDVASLGPIYFDGEGGLHLEIKTNIPCVVAEPGCSRVRGSFDVNGTYVVERDGTGIATINFPHPTGTIRYDFVIVKAKKKGNSPLALEVFAAGRKGGLAGQLIAPTWTRIFDPYEAKGSHGDSDD